MAGPMLNAVTRPVSPSLAQCELTHLARAPLDVNRAVAQHAAYERVLESLGARIVRVPEAPELPDAVFVEDTAIVLDEVAVVTRPGAASRRLETAAVAGVLEAYRPLVHILAPGTLDGGDVLRVGRTLYVGCSSRTNRQGVRQLEAMVRQFGYRVLPVSVQECLHLKSAVTGIGDATVLLDPQWVSPRIFADLEVVSIDPAEPGGANALWLGSTLVYPSHFPRTRERLEARGLEVRAVECGELAKAEGAVTCCSLIFQAGAEPA